MKYICKQCGVKWSARKRGDRIIKFCSQTCYGLSKKGKPTWNAGTKGLMKPNSGSFKKGHDTWNKGKKGGTPPNYKGWTTHSEGYIQITVKGHPKADKHGRVKRSVLAAEAILKRHLAKDEIIHHINTNRADDRPENLYLFPNQVEHMRYHGNYRYNNCEEIKISNIRP